MEQQSKKFFSNSNCIHNNSHLCNSNRGADVQPLMTLPPNESPRMWQEVVAINNQHTRHHHHCAGIERFLTLLFTSLVARLRTDIYGWNVL